MATAASLQAHFDEISAAAAVLPMSAAPKGFAQLDVVSLADGPATAKQVSGILSKAAANLQECQVCGCSCKAAQLGFLVTTQLDFAARSVRAAAGQFACEVCRAVSSPGLLLELAMPVPQSEDFTRAEQLRELFLHFAAVNAAPTHITANPEALALWVQELASRAYSMHVVASSLKGWQLHSPSGRLLQPGAAGAALQLLQELLPVAAPVAGPAAAVTGVGKPVKAAAGKHHSGKQQQPQPSAAALKDKQQQHKLEAGAAKPAKRKSLEAAAEAAGGSSKQRAKKQHGTPASAAAAMPAAKHTPLLQAKKPKRQQQQLQEQPDKTPEQQQQQAKTPKQPQPSRTPKLLDPAKTPTAPASAAQQKKQHQADGTSTKKLGLVVIRQEAAAPALTPGKKAAAAAVPFKTPQVAKVKKAKHRLSAE